MKTRKRQDLLIIACSARKRQVSNSVPAIELYDGPAFQVLRKRIRVKDGQPIIWVLSAKHGLIRGNQRIYGYDVKMNKKRAGEIRNQVQSFIECFAPTDRFHRIFIWAGKDYLLAFPPSFLGRSNVAVANGCIGKKLKLLKEWCAEWSTQ